MLNTVSAFQTNQSSSFRRKKGLKSNLLCQGDVIRYLTVWLLVKLNPPLLNYLGTQAPQSQLLEPETPTPILGELNHPSETRKCGSPPSQK